MASIYREILINARPEDVWAVVRNVGAAQYLVPGIIIDARLEEDTRILTFADGTVYHELIIDVNDDTRRVAYASIGGRTRHHNASMQVFADGADRSRLIWITDVAPNEFAASISKLMDQNSAVIKQTLEERKGRIS